MAGAEPDTEPARRIFSRVARVDLARALEERATLDLGLSIASEVVLFRSDPAPDGATYTVLDRAMLSG